MIELSEYEIHAYADGRLDGERRVKVELYLTRNPERAAEVQAWQRDAQRLRAVLADAPVLRPNPTLDPIAIRSRRHQRMLARLALAAVLVLCIGVGGLGGWQMRNQQIADEWPPMGDAFTAYRLLAMQGGAQPDLVSHHQGDLQSWLNNHFQRHVTMPDLSETGFRPVGGRLFATEEGTAAMVLYRDAAGRAISFYVRPPDPKHYFLPRGERVEGGLLAQYGSGNGYSYAMVSQLNHVDAQVAARALQPQI